MPSVTCESMLVYAIRAYLPQYSFGYSIFFILQLLLILTGFRRPVPTFPSACPEDQPILESSLKPLFSSLIELKTQTLKSHCFCNLLNITFRLKPPRSFRTDSGFLSPPASPAPCRCNRRPVECYRCCRG